MGSNNFLLLIYIYIYMCVCVLSKDKSDPEFEFGISHRDGDAAPLKKRSDQWSYSSYSKLQRQGMGSWTWGG
jgi:hypothetical protein